MEAWRWDAPAKNGNGGTARGCAGEKWQWARRINTPAESKGGVANECTGRKQEGGAANKYAGRKQEGGAANQYAGQKQEGGAANKYTGRKQQGWRGE
jgi:hypothetical protein